MHDFCFAADLEGTNTPIMLCNSNGIVVYKNKAAMEKLRLPKRRTAEMPHVSFTDITRYSDIGRRRKPSVVSVFTGDRYMRAFVTRVKRDDELHTVWIFLSAMQVLPSSRMVSYFERNLNDMASEICSVFKYTESSSRTPDHDMRKKLISCKRERITDIIKRFYKKPDPESESSDFRQLKTSRKVIYDCHYLTKMIGESAESTLRESSVDFRFTQQGCEENNLVDYTIVMPLVINAIIFSLSAARFHAVEFAADIKSGAVYKFRFSAICPELIGNDRRDLPELVKLAPSRATELQICDQLCRDFGFDIKYDVNDGMVDNVSITISIKSIPLSDISPSMRAHDSALERSLARQDVDKIFTCLAEDIEIFSR